MYVMERLFNFVVVKIMTQDNDKRLILLQQRNYDLQDKILTAIELLKKGNVDKALKILKKVLYEK